MKIIEVMGKASTSLMVVGATVSLIGWSLFFRMVSELNKVLPPDKKIPVFEFRNHISEIRRLHEDSFPDSALSTAWMILMVTAGLAWTAVVIVELIRTSR